VLLVGAAIGVEIDLTAYMVARYLGVKHYGLLYGILYSIVALGAGVGPALFGRAFDRTGSYSEVLEAAAIAVILSAGVLLTLGRYPDFRATADRA
jgi:cyanate permease